MAATPASLVGCPAWEFLDRRAGQDLPSKRSVPAPAADSDTAVASRVDCLDALTMENICAHLCPVGVFMCILGSRHCVLFPTLQPAEARLQMLEQLIFATSQRFPAAWTKLLSSRSIEVVPVARMMPSHRKLDEQLEDLRMVDFDDGRQRKPTNGALRWRLDRERAIWLSGKPPPTLWPSDKSVYPKTPRLLKSTLEMRIRQCFQRNKQPKKDEYYIENDKLYVNIRYICYYIKQFGVPKGDEEFVVQSHLTSYLRIHRLLRASVATSH